MDTIENLTLDLSSASKKKITVNNGTDTRDLYLNLSDLNLVVRYQEKVEELQKLENDAFINLSKQDVDNIEEVAKALKEIDTTLRETLDYIFDGNVSEACAPFGSMYDLINGKFRYELIMNSLSTLYDKSIKEETKKMEKRLAKHTGKYAKK